MRQLRVVVLLVVCVTGAAGRADAWWGWIDELSGDGPFHGWQLETRLMCFGNNSLGELRGLASDSQTLVHDALLMLSTDTLGLEGRRSSTDAGLRASAESFVTAVSELPQAHFDVSIRGLQPLAKSMTEFAQAVGKVTTELERACKIRQCQIQASFALQYLRTAESKLNAGAALATSAAATAAFGGGVTYSACPTEADLTRRLSIELTTSLMHTSESSQTRKFAGGNQTKLAILMPSVAWRPLAGKTVGGVSVDIADLAAGVGVYWISSDSKFEGGFESSSGLVLHPLRLDLHAPKSLAEKKFLGVPWLALPSYRIGLLMFPAGFSSNAFGATLTGDQATRLPSRRISAEWVRTQAIFVDLTPLTRAFKDKN